MIDYKLIRGTLSHQKEFEDTIKKEIKNGWRPTGGVSITNVGPTSVILVQALINPDPLG